MTNAQAAAICSRLDRIERILAQLVQSSGAVASTLVLPPLDIAPLEPIDFKALDAQVRQRVQRDVSNSRKRKLGKLTGKPLA